MEQGETLISTIVAGFVLAFVLGAIAHRLRQPPLVGYLLAGVLVGPYTPGFVADQGLVPQLAEIGVVLLMFGVGLSFSPRDLMAVRGIAVPGALVQMALGGALGWGLGLAMGWPMGGSVVFGLALSVASTVVVLKWLQDRHLVETGRGKIAVGWLIVEDIVMVLALVLIPAMVSLAAGAEAGGPLAVGFARQVGIEPSLWVVVGATFVKVALFIGLMLVVGRRLVPALLHVVAHSGSRELFRLSILATALGIAFGAAKLFGVSLALGAFFAGVILAESQLSSRAAQESLPLRDAFAVLFFVSVGMLFDPAAVLRDPLPVLATVAIIVLGRTAITFALVLAFGHSVGTALVLATARAQIGEFSFIVTKLAVVIGLLPGAAHDLVIGGALISIVLNPLLIHAGERLRPALERRLGAAVVPAEPDAAQAPAAAAEPAPPAEPAGETGPAPSEQTGHTVLIGFGRVGSVIGAALERAGTPHLVIEAGDTPIAGLRERGIEAFAGNAASPEVLARANLGQARLLVIAIPDAFEAGQIAQQARRTNAGLRIVARAHSDAEAEHLVACGADVVILAEREVARGMLARLGLDSPAETAAVPEAGAGEAGAQVAEAEKG